MGSILQGSEAPPGTAGAHEEVACMTHFGDKCSDRWVPRAIERRALQWEESFEKG